jgi:hypothetical protein
MWKKAEKDAAGVVQVVVRMVLTTQRRVMTVNLEAN